MNLTKSKTAKFVAGFVGLALAVSFVVTPVTSRAQTVADLQAQIAALLAQIAQLQALVGQPSTPGGSAPVPPLTVGSTGPEVVKLQQILVSKGFLTMPAGVAMGTFGPLTKSALAAWQAANGVSPAAGYYGSISAGVMASMMPTTPSPSPTTPTPAPVGITTPGVEGILTAELNPTPGSGTTVRGGDDKAPLLGIKLKALLSDIALQSVRVNMGTSLSIATKILENVYLMDGSNVLATMAPLSANISEEGTTRFVVFTGFNFIIPKGATRVLTVTGDLYTNVSGNTGSKTFTVPVNGVRGVDGAGLDQRSPATAFNNSVTVATALVDAATLTVTLAPDNPLSSQTVATMGSDKDEIERLTVAKVNAKATGDDVRIRDWQVTVYDEGSGAAVAGTAFLYDGTTELSSATISSDVATFSNLDLWVDKDQTRTFTLMVKITDAGAAVTGFSASTSAGAVVAENSEGSSVTLSGTASSSEVHNVLDKGLEITLLSKSITTAGVPQTSGSNNPSTSTLTATYQVRLKAVDGTVLLGTNASATPVFATSSTALSIYINDSASAVSSYATSSSVTFQNVDLPITTNTATLADGSQTDATFTFTIQGRSATAALTSGLYAVGLNRITWVSPAGAVVNSSFMNGKTAWKTSAVSFP